MSLLNGFSNLGSGLVSFANDAAKDEEARQLPLMSRPAPATEAQAPATAPGAVPSAVLADDPATGNKLDKGTLERAQAVYQGLVQRGMDPATAVGFAANAVQESRANPNTNPGDMGASHGLLQWRGDRLDRFVQQFGHAPEHGNLDEQLDYVMRELSGPEARAWQAIQTASNDPAAKAAAISRHYERPQSVDAEMTRRSYIANQLAGRFASLTNGGG